MLKRFDVVNYNCVGIISQTLTYFGNSLSNTLENDAGSIKLVMVASDEIFSHLKPILISVDPISSAILRIELADSRKIEVWKEHWECIQKNDYLITYLVNDEGKSMAAAQKEALPDALRQSDTFHGIAHKLGLWVDRLEKSAYKSIEYEEDRKKRLYSAKSEDVIDKKTVEYKQANMAADKAIQLYDSFHYLYLYLINNLLVFDNQGNLKKRETVEINIRTALELIGELKCNGISKEVNSIRNIIPELFSYLDEAKRIVVYLKDMNLPEEILKGFCIAWQYQKNRIKAKDANRRNKFKLKESEELELLSYELKDEFQDIRETVYSKLDEIIQSSSIVENINSIIRMYLNTTKNHVNQSFLNLIMFYHNHRRYLAGKRKGKTPMEILTNEIQKKDWLELLLERVNWQQCPNF